MRRTLLTVSAVVFGLVATSSLPAAAGPIGLLPGPGSMATTAATSSVSAPGIERVVFLLDGGSGFSGSWLGSGGANVCIGCFVGGPSWAPQPGTFGQGSTTNGAGTGWSGTGTGGFTGAISMPALPNPGTATSPFTLPFELFGTLNGFNVFGQGQLMFTAGGGALASGAPFQSSEAPEPASLLLLSTGAGALALARRRRRAARS